MNILCSLLLVLSAFVPGQTVNGRLTGPHDQDHHSVQVSGTGFRRINGYAENRGSQDMTVRLWTRKGKGVRLTYKTITVPAGSRTRVSDLRLINNGQYVLSQIMSGPQ